MAKDRNITLDLLKGVGILLMILGHMPIPRIVGSFIFSFHMPLFFFISGYLYREKPMSTTFKYSAAKVLIPYFTTGMLVWLVKSIIDRNYTWGLSLFLGNGSYPVYNFSDFYVGPLWFLACYFVSIIGFNVLLQIKENYRFPILLLLWCIAIVYKHYFNLLPFDLLNAVPAIVCLYIGYLTRRDSFIKKALEQRFFIIGSLIWATCIYRGSVSMASFVYRFWVFQLIGAFYGTIFIYKCLSAKFLSNLLGGGF